MGSYQIWPYHVTQAQNLSFSYLKSYCPLNFRKSHQIPWFCCIPNGSYKEDNLKEGRICPSPPQFFVRSAHIEFTHIIRLFCSDSDMKAQNYQSQARPKASHNGFVSNSKNEADHMVAWQRGYSSNLVFNTTKIGKYNGLFQKISTHPPWTTLEIL